MKTTCVPIAVALGLGAGPLLTARESLPFPDPPGPKAERTMEASKHVLGYHGLLSGESSQWEPAIVENTVRIETKEPLPTGKVEIESRRGPERVAAMDVVIRANGKEMAKGKVPRIAPAGFTTNDSFDVGIDQYSPVSDAYFEQAPFKFNGTIRTMDVTYLK
jgi:hypothetical protein